MKRKVVLHGSSTLTVSLPSSWIKKFNIKKGDELNLLEQGREIKISTESTSFEKKEIDIKNLKRVGKSYITSSYRQGYDELNIKYNNENYLETIQDLLSKEITGFEVIRHQSNSCIIKDLSGQNIEEFNTALRRIWLLILDLSEESIKTINKELSEIKNIKIIDNSINKFSNYCMRILIKRGNYDSKKTSPYYYFVKSLEEIADKYKELCIFHFNNKKKVNDDVLKFFMETNSYLNEVYSVFYTYDEQKIESLFDETKKVIEQLNSLNNNAALYLSFITRDIRNLLPLIIEINA